MNLYIKKPEYVQAVQFKYSEEGIAEMKEFCLDVINYRKERHISAIGKATLVIQCSLEFKLDFEEGDYVIKNSVGEFNIMSSKKFNELYTIL